MKYTELSYIGVIAAVRECARITAPEVTDEEFEYLKTSNDPKFARTLEEISRSIKAYLEAADPSPRAQALEFPTERVNMPEPGSDARIIGFRIREGDKQWGKSGLYEPMRWLNDVQALALSSQPVADGLPQDVINLVIAAREAFDTGVIPDEEENNLDKALEPFGERVPYENEPEEEADAKP